MNAQESIVSCEWLVKELNNPKLAIADCRFLLSDPDWGKQQYLINHIPGAFYLDLNQNLSSPIGKHGGRHPLPDPEIFAAKLETLGIILGETLVIAYDDSRLVIALFWP
jgi:thiosulfate/3-mercaptopyruvate sulfurtransferase